MVLKSSHMPIDGLAVSSKATHWNSDSWDRVHSPIMATLSPSQRLSYSRTSFYSMDHMANSNPLANFFFDFVISWHKRSVPLANHPKKTPSKYPPPNHSPSSSPCLHLLPFRVSRAVDASPLWKKEVMKHDELVEKHQLMTFFIRAKHGNILENHL